MEKLDPSEVCVPVLSLDEMNLLRGLIEWRIVQAGGHPVMAAKYSGILEKLCPLSEVPPFKDEIAVANKLVFAQIVSV